MRTTPPTAIDWLDNSPLLGLYTEPSYCWLAAPGAIYGSSEGACDAIGSGVVRFPPHSSFYNETCTHIRSGFFFFFFLSLLFSVMERVPPSSSAPTHFVSFLESLSGGWNQKESKKVAIDSIKVRFLISGGRRNNSGRVLDKRERGAAFIGFWQRYYYPKDEIV